MKTLLLLLVPALVLIWFFGDLLYARIVLGRASAWEATIQRTPDGVREGCEAFSMGEGETALLLVHGFGDSAVLYRRMAERWAQSGFTCRSMRMPGFAEALEAQARYGIEDWVDSVRREHQALLERHDRVWLVAHSMGGAVVDRYLDDDDHAPVAGLVMLAPLVRVGEVRSPILSPRAWFNFCDRLTIFTRVLESSFPIDAHDPEVREHYPRNPFVPSSVHRDMFRLIAENFEHPGGHRLPLFTAVSPNDLVVDVQAVGAWAEDWNGRPKKVLPLPGAGHVLPWDYGWDDLTDAVTAFIRETESGPTGD